MTDMNMHQLKAICRQFFDQGILSASEMVREVAQSGRTISLEDLADLIENTAKGRPSDN